MQQSLRYVKLKNYENKIKITNSEYSRHYKVIEH
jgi:hypothetical protein